MQTTQNYFNFDFDPVGENDLNSHRVMELDNGNKVHFKIDGIHGFWSVNLDKGQLPEHLLGRYTSYSEAEKDVLLYLSRKDREVVAKKDTVAENRKK